MFVLVDDRGQVLGEFDAREAAKQALVTAVEASGGEEADSLALVELDEQGRRVGGPYVARFGDVVSA